MDSGGFCRSDNGFDLFHILANNDHLRLRNFDALQDVNDESRPSALLTSSELNLIPEITHGLEFNGTISQNEQSSSQSAAPQYLLQREFTDQDGEFNHIIGVRC